MSDYNLGTARGVIRIDYTGDGPKKATQDLDSVTKKSDAVNKAAGTMGAGLTGAGTVMAAGFAVAAKSAIDYEKRMSAVQAVSGASQQEMKGLSDLALRLGQETKYSASESASAIEELVKAGISVPDVMNGAAQATVALASAGEIALPEAASIASNAMNQFNLTAAEMPLIADKIAGAANASAIDVGEFGYSLSQVGAVANLAGLSFEDTAVAIAEMGNAGIKGSDAGTSLKTFLQNLQPMTLKQQQLFEELGITTKELGNRFYDAEGKLKPLAEVQEILAQSLKGMTAEQKQATLETMFGSDAIRAAAVLANNGAKGYDEMATAMSKVTAEQVAAARQDNLAGKWEQLTGSLETMAIQIGQILLPVLKQFIGFIQKLVDAWANLSPRTQKIIVLIAAIVTVFVLVVGIVLSVVAGFAALAAVFAAAGTALLPVIGIAAAIAAGLIALIAIVVLVIKNWDNIKAATMAVWNAIAGFFVGIWTAIKNAFMVGVTAVGTFLTTAWTGIVGFFKTIWGGVATFFAGLWNGILAVLQGVWTIIITVITGYLNGVKMVISAVTTVILGVWQAFWNTFGGLITAVWELIKVVVALGIRAVQFVVISTARKIQAVWLEVWGAISKFFRTIWNAIADFIGPIVNSIRAVITRVINAVKSFISDRLNAIKSVFSAAWSAVATKTASVYASIKEKVTSVLNTIRSFIADKLSAIKTSFSNAWNAVLSKAREVFSKVVSVISDKVRAIIDKVRTIHSKVVDTMRNAGSWLYNAGRNIIQGLINGVTSKIGAFTSKLRDLTNRIPDLKGPPKRDKVLLERNGELIMGGLIRGIESGIGPLSRLLGSVTLSVPGMVKTSALTTPSSITNVTNNSAGPKVYQDVKIYHPIATRDSEATNESLQLAGAFV